MYENGSYGVHIGTSQAGIERSNAESLSQTTSLGEEEYP